MIVRTGLPPCGPKCKSGLADITVAHTSVTLAGGAAGADAGRCAANLSQPQAAVSVDRAGCGTAHQPRVSRRDIAGIWVAFFSRCQRYSLLTGGGAQLLYTLPDLQAHAVPAGVLVAGFGVDLGRRRRRHDARQNNRLLLQLQRRGPVAAA